MTNRERTALAMLSSGASWADACDYAGVSFERMQHLWAEREAAKAKSAA